MKVAGLGFRASADVASLRAALVAAGGAEGVTALATSEAKAGAAVILALAAELGVPVISVSALDLAASQHSSSVVSANWFAGC